MGQLRERKVKPHCQPVSSIHTASLFHSSLILLTESSTVWQTVVLFGLNAHETDPLRGLEIDMIFSDSSLKKIKKV